MQHILFIDIETVAEQPSYDLLKDHWKKLWDKKVGPELSANMISKQLTYTSKAALYPEFARICCISVGKVAPDGSFVTRSFTSIDEAEILTLFCLLLEEEKNISTLCAHNGKSFDFPFIAKRLMKYGLKVPNILKQIGKKPWEIYNLDTMEQWSMGAFGSKTSLDTLCAFFDIPSPKDEIDGSVIHDLFHNLSNTNMGWSAIEMIKKYCEKDVVALYEVYKRINQ